MNMPQWLVIGISGVTCGGKTTLSHSLREYFHSKRNTRVWQTPYTIGDVQLISQDDYFLPVDDRRHKWIEKLNAINFELMTSLDMKQMLSDITWTMKGRYLVGDPMDNIDFLNEMSIPATNYEQYNSGSLPPMQLMPPPTQMLHYHSSKMHQHSQQQQQHYQNTNHYYHSSQTHHQHHHRLHQQQQPTRQHYHQQQQQRHSLRIAANSVSVAANSSNSNVANMKLHDCKVNILIIDGFMIFNQPELLTLCNIKFHFHLPYEKCYERRRQRVYEPPDVTGYFEMCVWPYYEKNFAEFRDRKDITFLNGEIGKERIRDFVLQRIAKYVEERCDAPLVVPTATIATFTAPPPALQSHNKVDMHNGNNCGIAKPCPMEQQ